METETDLSMQNISHLIEENGRLKQRLASLEEECSAAKQKAGELENKHTNHAIITKEVVMQSAKTVKFYTGFVSTAMFTAFLQFVLSAWKPSCATWLDAETQLIMVLMRLRLGLLTQDLSCRFGISNATVSSFFHAWLDVLAANMTKLIIWPSRQTLQANRPAAFQDPFFDGVTGIIDCTEVFIQRPILMTARSQTYSHYKHHNTVKILVVISPSGAITFVSKAWGGRTPDKEITLRSGLLDKVKEGDVFLVDRGFRCGEMFAARGATLLMPSLTKNRAQLPGAEVTTSRKVSSVRIHVERAIQRLKVFRIFQTVLPLNFVKRTGDKNLASIDKVVVVCSALVNLQTPIIKNSQRRSAS
ncbi:uncharacterized protein LOC144115681 [Amblyomma americanum]